MSEQISDEELDRLLRRAIEARNPLRCKELLPFTLAPAQMRAEADRRSAAEDSDRETQAITEQGRQHDVS